MKEYLHENTIIHTNVYYVVQNGKRVYSDQPPPFNRKQAVFHFDAYLQPPLLSLPHAWNRYNFSLQDVITTYDKLDTSYTWQVALLLLTGVHETESFATGVRATFQSLFTFLFISRKTMLNMLLQYVKPNDANQTSVLCKERLDHRPFLPKVQVSLEDFYALKKQIPDRHPSFAHVATYANYYTFKDIRMIPTAFDEENSLVYMVRIITDETYKSWPITRKPCVLTLPVYVQIREQTYVLTDEACFFTMMSATNPPTKRKARTNATVSAKRSKLN